MGGGKPRHADFYEKGNALFGADVEVQGNLTIGGSAVAMAPGVTGDGDDGLTIAEALSVGELSTLTGGAAIGDGKDIAVGSGTGTKIGTATGQKLGFYGHAPIAQAVLATGGAATADDIITFLQAIGLCKQS